MVEITFLGHACFQLTHDGKTILVDPFLNGNPVASTGADGVWADLILVTHGHSDHVGDAVSISKRTGSPVFTAFELSLRLQAAGAKVVGGNHGGTHDFGFAKVKITWASHSSGYINPNTGEVEEAGNPCGFIVHFGGKTFYHAGDTALFGDMALVSGGGKLDVAMIPIGGFFTMDAHDAVEAVRLLKPSLVIPMHYNTFPQIQADHNRFRQDIEANTPSKCSILAPGEKIDV